MGLVNVWPTSGRFKEIRMKIVFVSDLHGYTPEIPECDVCCFIGDYQRCDTRWENSDYFLRLKERCITVGVAGNHDFHLERDRQLGPKMFTHYLLDTSVEVNGIKFFGTPYTLLDGYSFYKSEEELRTLYDKMYYDFILGNNFPDIILSHQPAYGVLDRNNPNRWGPSENCGSKSLLEFVKKCEPSLHCCGHIHEGFGMARLEHPNSNNYTTCLNVAYCGQHLQIINLEIVQNVIQKVSELTVQRIIRLAS